MSYIEPDEYEQELIRFFAQRYREQNECVDYHEFPRYEEKGIGAINWARDRLTQIGVITGEHSTGIRVLPKILEVLELINNPPKPPLPDYRDARTNFIWPVVSQLIGRKPFGSLRITWPDRMVAFRGAGFDLEFLGGVRGGIWTA